MKKFTLIELLVVVAIIGILASLLLPSLGKSRQTAIGMVCISNMKQIHVAQAMYTDDNDQVMMRARGGGSYWWRDIATYAGYKESGAGVYELDLDRFSSSNVYKCPSATLSPGLDWQWTKYGYNFYADNTDEAPSRYDAVKLNLVSDPVNALMLMDTDRWKFQPGTWGNAAARHVHNNNTNTIFVDGHSRTNVRELYQIQLLDNQSYWYEWAWETGK